MICEKEGFKKHDMSPLANSYLYRNEATITKTWFQQYVLVCLQNNNKLDHVNNIIWCQGCHQVRWYGSTVLLNTPSANQDNTMPCGRQQGTIRLSCLGLVCVHKQRAEQGHVACILALHRDLWNCMLVDLMAEWQVGSKLQLAAESRGSSMWCANLNSLRETAEARQDAPVSPSSYFFGGNHV